MKDAARVWPVAVRIGKTESTAVLMNRKAFQKSLENRTPWIVHPATGRVLPWPGEPAIDSLNDGPGRFELDLPQGSMANPYGEAAPFLDNPDDRSVMDEVTGNQALSEDVLPRLSKLVAGRHRSMPEGSYTTMLFEKGLDKIRKKIGEEAVELLLAQNDKDVVYEAADLIYHLVVLLEASGLSWSDVTKELARRHGE